MQAANSSQTETLKFKPRRHIDHQPDVNPTAYRNAVPRLSLLKYEMLRPLRLHMWRHSSVQLIPGFAATFKSASIFYQK